MMAMRCRRRGSVKRTLISISSSAASFLQAAAERHSGPARWSFQEVWTVMLNWPRVTCSSSASILAFLEEEEVGDAGDHAGLVPADDGDGGESFITDAPARTLLASSHSPPQRCPAEVIAEFRLRFCPPRCRPASGIPRPDPSLPAAKSFDPSRNFP